jgi:transposase-like protein
MPSNATSLGKLLAAGEVREVRCPKCGGKAAKAGVRKTAQGPVRKYRCPHCKMFFSSAPMPHRSYAPSVILNAITEYDLGKTIAETKAYLLRRFRKDIPLSTLHSWISQFRGVCTFIGYRKKYSIVEEEVIVSKTFSHRQEYRFAFHRLKANMFCKTKFPEARKYLWDVADRCPQDLFLNEENGRCSEAKLSQVKLSVMRQPDNNAVLLARLGLMLASVTGRNFPQPSGQFLSD